MKTPQFLVRIALLAATAIVASAQPIWTLDPAFRPSVTYRGSGGGQIYSMVPQADGRVIAAGAYEALNGVARNNLARLLPDGSIDEAFDAGMTVRFVHSNHHVVRQSDGKLIVVGEINLPSGKRSGPFRLDHSGRLDPTFRAPALGDDAGNVDYSRRVFLLPEDRLLVTGSFGPANGSAHAGIARLHADGSLDKSFVPGVTATDVSAIAVLPDGKIILAGSFLPQRTNPTTTLRMVRLKADGSRDALSAPSLRYDAWPSDGLVGSFVVQSDGKIVIAGRFSEINGVPRPSVARLIPMGQDLLLDEDFNPSGLVIQPLREASISAMAVPGSDRLLVWGGSAGIVRLEADGQTDSTWAPAPGVPVGFSDGNLLTLSPSGDGLVRHDAAGKPQKAVPVIPEIVGGAHKVDVQSDGKILFQAASRIIRQPRVMEEPVRINGVTHESRLVRLNADGRVDANFNPRLISSDSDVPSVGAPGTVKGYALMPSGHIVIAGNFHSVNGVECDRMARLNPDGSVDASFRPVGLPLWASLHVLLLPQTSGHLLVQAERSVLRFTPAGVLDPSFTSDFGINLLSRTVGPDDQFLASNATGQIVRLNADGTADAAFVPFEGGWFWPLLALPDRRWIVQGYRDTATATYPSIVRLQADGRLDRTFNFDPGPPFRDDAQVVSATLAAEDKLLVGLASDLGDGTIMAGLIRLQANGSRDATFPAFTAHLTKALESDNPSGFAPRSLTAILPQPDGGMFLAGAFIRVNGEPRLGFARFRLAPALRAPVIAPDGSLRFSIGGELGWTYRIESSADLVNWTLLRELPSAGAVTEFVDLDSSKLGQRFYRASLRL